MCDPEENDQQDDAQSNCSADTWQIQEEVIRWMTEGTDPHMSPRSDCG
jgi:hypothetical protein